MVSLCSASFLVSSWVAFMISSFSLLWLNEWDGLRFGASKLTGHGDGGARRLAAGSISGLASIGNRCRRGCAAGDGL